MSRFDQREQQHLRNPEAAASFAEQPHVAHTTLPDARPYVARVIHMNWRRGALLPPGVIIVLLCILSLASILTPGTSWLGKTVAVLLFLGFVALPAILLWSITIELTEDHIRQRDMPLAMNEMPYSAIQKITIDQRITNIRGYRHFYYLVIHDEQGAKMQIDMIQFRHEDLRTVINTVASHAPHVRLDPNTRAFQARQFTFRY